MKKKIKAEIIAGSLNEHGQRITTWVLTYPRIIHAEMMTHRVFSRNAASSRAIPSKVMRELVESDPFIPVAWQEEHKGMQGTEYCEDLATIESLELEWLDAKDQAVKFATRLTNMETTKQLTNRLLEPFQWYTAIFTATETENFFDLRCPQYDINGDQLFKSWKDICNYNSSYKTHYDSLLAKLKLNKGAGEIHISLLAEAMWDSMNEYDYKQLKAGEWHVPFGDRFDYSRLCELPKPQGMIGSEQAKLHEEYSIKIATARCARVSYLNFEGEDDYESDIKLYDRLLKMGHFSPFEHCARAMTNIEMEQNVQGNWQKDKADNLQGWSGNFKGFVQLRQKL